MSVFTPIKINKTNKVHPSEYISTQNEPVADSPKPSDNNPTPPAAAEAK
jgi:hypothetical protein